MVEEFCRLACGWVPKRNHLPHFSRWSWKLDGGRVGYNRRCRCCGSAVVISNQEVSRLREIAMWPRKTCTCRRAHFDTTWQTSSASRPNTHVSLPLEAWGTAGTRCFILSEMRFKETIWCHSGTKIKQHWDSLPRPLITTTINFTTSQRCRMPEVERWRWISISSHLGT